MITIIFGKPRSGKTALMSYLLTNETFNNSRISDCRREIDKLNKGGFDLNYPDYIVACNFRLECHKFGYSPRLAKRINPYRVGFNNPNVKTHFLPPFCCIGIMEAQKYFNSRNFSLFPDWQSRFYEMHGHNHYDIYLDTQRPNLIDVNIRELSRFIEIVEFVIGNKTICWTVREFAGLEELEVYKSSGRKDTSTFDEYSITAERRLLDYYDTRESKPLFYDGHFKQDYDKMKPQPHEPTLSGYLDYCSNYSAELPDKFYQKKGASANGAN